MLSVGHQRCSQSYIRIASFLLTSFSKFAFSHFRDSVLQSIEAYNASYQFIHQQCCLLVTKDAHNLVFASQFFSLTSFSQFPSSKIVISFLRISGTYIDFNHFIHQQCCLCWSPKLITILHPHGMFFRWHLSDSLLLETSGILFYEALRCIMLFFLFINSFVCWSQKCSQSCFRKASFFADIFLTFPSSNFVIFLLWSFEAYSASHHFFHQQCCLLVTTDAHNLVVVRRFFSLTSFVTVRFWRFREYCTSLRRVICLLPLSSSTVLSVGHQKCSQSCLRVASFFADIFLTFPSSNFVIFLLCSFEAYNASYQFIHQQCFLLVIKDGHTPIFASQVSLSTSFSLFATGNFVISVLRSLEAFDVFYHFIHQQCCLLVTKDGHNLIFASQVFLCRHLCHSLLLATSWFLYYKASRLLWGFLPLEWSTVVSAAH